MTKLRIGTRGSRLALTQARLVEKRLRDSFPSLETEIRRIRTTGDMNPLGDLSRMGGKGVFVKEIEDALLSGGIDLAVHSMKGSSNILLEVVKVTLWDTQSILPHAGNKRI